MFILVGNWLLFFLLKYWIDWIILLLLWGMCRDEFLYFLVLLLIIVWINFFDGVGLNIFLGVILLIKMLFFLILDFGMIILCLFKNLIVFWLMLGIFFVIFFLLLVCFKFFVLILYLLMWMDVYMLCFIKFLFMMIVFL